MISASLDSLFPVLIRLLLEPAIRSFAMAILVALGLKLFRVKRSAFLAAIWTGVLYAALVMPLLSRLIPAVLLPLKTFSGDQLASIARKSGSNFLIDRFTTRVSDRRFNQTVPQVYAQAPAHGSVSGSAIAAAIYLLVSGFLLARLELGWLVSRKLRRTINAVTDFQVLEEFSARVKAAKPARSPVLCDSAGVVVPLTFGVIHPLILLPADWRNWEKSKLNAVLEHEISHVAQRLP